MNGKNLNEKLIVADAWLRGSRDLLAEVGKLRVNKSVQKREMNWQYELARQGHVTGLALGATKIYRVVVAQVREVILYETNLKGLFGSAQKIEFQHITGQLIVYYAKKPDLWSWLRNQSIRTQETQWYALQSPEICDSTIDKSSCALYELDSVGFEQTGDNAIQIWWTNASGQRGPAHTLKL